jgi:hypothetical protein
VAAEEEEKEEPAAKIEVEKLHPDFGARLHHVDLEALTDEQWETIQDAFDEYGVIVISDQGDSLDPKALTDFACRFHREDPTECGRKIEIVALLRLTLRMHAIVALSDCRPGRACRIGLPAEVGPLYGKKPSKGGGFGGSGVRSPMFHSLT